MFKICNKKFEVIFKASNSDNWTLEFFKGCAESQLKNEMSQLLTTCLLTTNIRDN